MSLPRFGVILDVYETQYLYMYNRRKEKKKKKEKKNGEKEKWLEHCWFSAINRRGYIRQIFIHIIYIFGYVYTILVRACLVRPMPNYHILILGLNGGLLVKHKKNTILLTSDSRWEFSFFFFFILFFICFSFSFNGRIYHLAGFASPPEHRSLDPFDSTFETAHVARLSFRFNNRKRATLSALHFEFNVSVVTLRNAAS